MQAYQTEYIANLRAIVALSVWKPEEGQNAADFAAQVQKKDGELHRLEKRNIELLRDNLFPALDNLFSASDERLQSLKEFAAQLLNSREELDDGLFCRIHEALLALARQKKDRAGVIRELYWLGIGSNSRSRKLVGLTYDDMEPYMTRMRLCFTEAAAYLKYYDELEDESRDYVLRSRANMALGQFRSPLEKIRLLKSTLQIMKDPDYQQKAPALPWERYIYMVHQQIAASIPYGRENILTPDDTAAIMESTYIVYQRRVQETAEQQVSMPIRWAFPHYAIEFYCGFYSLDDLLAKIEQLMDAADLGDFSLNGMYAMVSLPAFYCQFLARHPDRLAGRAAYLENLYRRIVDYMRRFSNPSGEFNLFQYLRQLCHTYLETENSIPYGDFLQRILVRFAPSVYVHSQKVGHAAQALCESIMTDEPGFFDDIPFLRDIVDPAAKRQAVLRYAMDCGVFHDVGKINFIELYSRVARQWFEEEYEAARLHTVAGETMLSARASTGSFAAAALGHHAWYDGSDSDSDRYRRLECPERQMVDVIGLIDWLENVTHATRTYTGVEKTFDEAIRDVLTLEGKRFSPLLTSRLREPAVVERIRQAFSDGCQSAIRRMLDDAQE